MAIPLNVLFVEDSADDAAILLDELQSAGFDPKWKRVETEASFLAEIKNLPDIILSDYSMPQFSGLKAAKILEESGLNIPFILISGTVGEDVAVEAMKHGATDYLLKDRIGRLGPAVQHALEVKRLRDEHNHAENEQRKSEERFRQMEKIQANILNALPAHIALVNPDGVIISVNDAWHRFATANARPGPELGMGQNYIDICLTAHGEHSDEAQAVASGLRQVLRGEAKEFTIEYPCHSPMEQRWFRLIATPLREGQQPGAVVMHLNTTEQRKAEMALQKGEREMRQLAGELESERTRLIVAQTVAKIGSWETDLKTLAVNWSDETHHIFETDSRTFCPTHQGFMELVHPEDRAAVEAVFRGSFNQRESCVFEHRLCLAQGQIKFVEERWQIFFDDFGKPARAIGTCQDISERKRADQKLRESEERFRQLAENIHEVFWITDPSKSQMLYISPGYEKIWGRSCESVYQSPQTWLEAIHPEDLSRILEASVNKQTGGIYDEIYRIVRPDGSLRWIHDRAFPIRDAVGEVYRIVGTAEDITRQRELEEQFRQAQKMESIGQLAGGVAHDFNNLLTVINCYSQLLLESPGLPPDAGEMLKEVFTAGERAAKLTQQLLTFSRKQAIRTEIIDLNEIVTDVAKMLRRLIGENIELQMSMSEGLPPITADVGMMDQVLMNLAVNARDAMPKGGRLSISTKLENIDEQSARQNSEARPGQFVCLKIRDTGCGMSPEVLTRIFEPFFTTKEIGKGTGLGLATVFGIVKQHNGWIEVESEPGSGAAFKVFLPAAAQTAAQPGEVTAAQSQGGTETILLVEDEDALRGMALIILQKYGYRVLEATNGPDALQVWEQHHGKIDLLLTDMVMPGGMTGHELAEKLKAFNPALKAVYTSGYSAEMSGLASGLRDKTPFLQKPYHPQKLATTIRACLDVK